MQYSSGRAEHPSHVQTTFPQHCLQMDGRYMVDVKKKEQCSHDARSFERLAVFGHSHNEETRV